MRTKPDRRKGANSIQIEEELAKPLKEFSTRCGVSGAQLARVILAFGLPKLISGEYAIVNGEITANPRGERQPA